MKEEKWLLIVSLLLTLFIYRGSLEYKDPMIITHSMEKEWKKIVELLEI